MATIKSYTDISQSKKLAEILPIESADMWYHPDLSDYPDYVERCSIYNIPCWSLAALLDQLEGRNSLELVIKYDDGQYYLVHADVWETKYYDDLIDACVEMIIKLNELNLL